MYRPEDAERPDNAWARLPSLPSQKQPAELTRDQAAEKIAALFSMKRGFALHELNTYTHEGRVQSVCWRCQTSGHSWSGNSLQELVRLMELEAEVATIKGRTFGV